ncbi:acylphosphatase [Candidatus Nitrospira bockiana]
MERASWIRAHVSVRGDVQGVGYRAYAHRMAREAGLCGGVRNLPDGRVEVQVEGEAQAVERFLDALRIGPPLARVDQVEVERQAPTGSWSDFRIWY